VLGNERGEQGVEFYTAAVEAQGCGARVLLGDRDLEVCPLLSGAAPQLSVFHPGCQHGFSLLAIPFAVSFGSRGLFRRNLPTIGPAGFILRWVEGPISHHAAVFAAPSRATSGLSIMHVSRGARCQETLRRQAEAKRADEEEAAAKPSDKRRRAGLDMEKLEGLIARRSALGQEVPCECLEDETLFVKMKNQPLLSEIY